MGKNLTPSRSCIAAAAAVSAAWSVLCVVLMTSYRERGDFGYTGAVDYTARMVLILLCTACFAAAMLRLVLFCLKGGDAQKALAAAFSWLGYGVLCAIVVCAISLYREFQNSARLLEDAMYLLLTIGAGLALLIGAAMKGSARGMFISGVTAVIALAVPTLLGLLLFRENTYRTLNFMYYAHRIGYLPPFLTAAAAVKVLQPRAEIRIVPAGEEPAQAEDGSNQGAGLI